MRGKFGVYSQLAVDNGSGFSVWRNVHGETVRVTIALDSNWITDYWPDMIGVGMLMDPVEVDVEVDVDVEVEVDVDVDVEVEVEV